jgi:hypothetical protein
MIVGYLNSVHGGLIGILQYFLPQSSGFSP